MKKTVLKVNELRVSFDTYLGEVQAVRGVSFSIKEGETLALVGESGCGKSVTAQTILKLNPMPPARIKSGEIQLNGADMVRADKKTLREMSGSVAGMIFQDPMTSLNPTITIGRQIAESLVLHRKMTWAQAGKEAVEILGQVRIANPEQRARQYPGQLSGGMRQRVMIGLAIACHPRLLIADEPTTALDVTVQAQIMDLLRSIQRISGTAIMLITHDLGVAAGMAHRIVVMYAGKIVESGPADRIFEKPSHPYTRGLLSSIPKPGQNKDEDLKVIEGTPPALISPPKGCGFAERCPSAMNICRQKEPPCFSLGGEHAGSCWLLHPEAGGQGQIAEGGEEHDRA